MKNIFFILLLLSLNTCKKEDVPDKNPCSNYSGDTMTLSLKFEDFKYKSGTYWILRDTLNGNTEDSVYVTSSDEGYILADYCNMTLQYYYLHTNYGLYSLIEYSKIKNNCQHTILNLNESPYDSLLIGSQYYYNVYQYRGIDCNNNHVTHFMSGQDGFIKIETENASSQVISRKILQRKNIIR